MFNVFWIFINYIYLLFLVSLTTNQWLFPQTTKNTSCKHIKPMLLFEQCSLSVWDRHMVNRKITCCLQTSLCGGYMATTRHSLYHSVQNLHCTLLLLHAMVITPHSKLSSPVQCKYFIIYISESNK